MFRDDCLVICLDDKHRLKVGEPGFPVAAAERGRRVIAYLQEEFQVADHDSESILEKPSGKNDEYCQSWTAICRPHAKRSVCRC